MASRHSIEAAYCFFHQKWRVYSGSALDWQRDDIEAAIADYADSMDADLYELLAQGRRGFLKEHTTFAADLPEALGRLEALMAEAGA